MSFNSQKHKQISKIGLLGSLFFSTIPFLQVSAQNSKTEVDSSVDVIDGLTAPYNAVQPGDTLRACERK